MSEVQTVMKTSNSETRKCSATQNQRHESSYASRMTCNGGPMMTDPDPALDMKLFEEPPC